MLKVICKATIYIVVVGLTSIVCGFLLGEIFLRYAPFWQKADLLPRGKIVRIESVGMIPMGHIDNVYVVNDLGEVYLWVHDPINMVTRLRKEKWELIALPPTGEKIQQLQMNSAYPNYGVFIKTDKGKVYEKTEDGWKMSNVILTKQEEDSNEVCRSWPNVSGPLDKVIDRKKFCAIGALSEEMRDYALTSDGRLMYLSRTVNPFTLFYNFALGAGIGLPIGIFVNFFLVRKFLNKIFNNVVKQSRNRARKKYLRRISLLRKTCRLELLFN